MLEAGIVVFIGFWLLWRKLSVITRLKLLGRPFLLDASVTIMVFVLYGNSASGLMAASLAALAFSIFISWSRKWYGYYRKEDGRWWYIIGKWNQSEAIIAEKKKHLIK